MGKGSFLNTRRQTQLVLPCGVAVEFRNLTGAHQAMITDEDEQKRKNSLDEMLLSCLVRIGNKTELSIKDVERFLTFDKANLLFNLRQFSNRQSPTFIFDFEYPVDKGGSKRKQRYEIKFTKKDFPVAPYIWVAEKMQEDWRDNNSQATDYVLNEDELFELYNNNPFPEMYESYEDMLRDNKNQEVDLPDSGVTIYWTLSDGESEKKQSRFKTAKNSHSQLLMANPLYKDENYVEGKPMPAVPLNQLSQDDIEALRKDILKKSAKIETTVVLQYQDDVSVQAQVSLISLPAFFFPSLAA